MKKQVALAMGLAVLSGSAFASKARLEALGEDAYGSMFISDNRNVFLNAGTVNFHKDLVTMEWGDSSNSQDGADAPRAEGGVFKSSGNMVYGLYFGEESNTANGLRALTGNVGEMNSTSIFVGGDAGIQWGASLLYQTYKDEQAANDQEANAMRARVGAISGDIEGFANIGISNKAETDSGLEFEGKSSFDIGVTWNQGDVAYMARVSSIQAEEKDSGDEFKAQNTWIGAAKSYKLNDKANMWVSGWYKMDKKECDTTFQNANGPCGTAEEKSDTYLPVTVALEVAAKEWLVLRGSVGQDVFVHDTDNGDDKKTRSNTTKVNAGASLVFGDLTLDGMIGNNADDNTVAGSDTSNGGGTLRTDTLMSRVSMTYRF